MARTAKSVEHRNKRVKRDQTYTDRDVCIGGSKDTEGNKFLKELSEEAIVMIGNNLSKIPQAAQYISDKIFFDDRRVFVKNSTGITPMPRTDFRKHVLTTIQNESDKWNIPGRATTNSSSALAR